MAVVQRRGPTQSPIAFGTSSLKGSHLLPSPSPSRSSSSLSWRHPPPLPAWVVLEPYVDLETEEPPTNGGDQAWASVYCARKKAYGCGKHTQKVLDGLFLYQRIIGVGIPHVSSALYIKATETALRSIRAEFAEGRKDSPFAEFDQSDCEVLFSKASIEAVEENLMVLTVVFRLGGSRLVYFMVYDAVDTSLALIPCPPDPYPSSVGTPKPLPVRRDDGSYELLVISERRVTPPKEQGNDEEAWHEFKYEDVLYVFTPTDANFGDLWRVRGLQIPEVMGPFAFEVMFSCKGKAFFVDLSQGILFFNLPAAADSSVGEIDFMYLPVPCEPRWEMTKPEDGGPRNISRTMRCIGDFIKFICIDSAAQRVTVWTLDMSQKKWLEEEREKEGEEKPKAMKKSKGFPFQDLWRSGRYPSWLPKTKPRFPILMPDGSLCLVLPYRHKKQGDPKVDYICNLILTETSHAIHITLCWWSSLTEYRYTHPVIAPSNFFKRIYCPKFPLRGGIFI